MVTIRTRPALTSSSRITVARVACTTGLSRLGCVMITRGFPSGVAAIRPMTLQAREAGVQRELPRARAQEFRKSSRRASLVGRLRTPAGVVELVDTPALGAGGRRPLG